MKWVMLIGAGMLGLDFWFRDDVIAGIFAIAFAIGAVSLWKDDDVV